MWSYSAKRFARDNKTLTAQENRARAAIEGDKPARTPRFVHTQTDGLVLDEAALARARRLAGLTGLVTNWGVTLLVDSRYQEGTTRRDVIDTQEVHPGVQG